MKTIIGLSIVVCIFCSSCDDRSNTSSSSVPTMGSPVNDYNQDSTSHRPVETGKGSYQEEPSETPETLPSTSASGGTQPVITPIQKKDTIKRQTN